MYVNSYLTVSARSHNIGFCYLLAIFCLQCWFRENAINISRVEQMCSKILQPSSLVVVFETLLSAAATTVDDEKGNPSWQPQADFYIICILSCLPWGGAELTEVATNFCF